MLADDLMAAVFPDAAACLENIPGDRQIPDHPLVAQTVRDCLEEAMDFDGLAAVLDASIAESCGSSRATRRSRRAFAHEILNAQPYAFLDDAPLEERRTQAVQTRRGDRTASGDELGALDRDAIERVRDEARPDPRDADELHDALLTAGFCPTRKWTTRPGLSMMRWPPRVVRAAPASTALVRRKAFALPPSGCPSCSRFIRALCSDRRLKRPPPGRACWERASAIASCFADGCHRRVRRRPATLAQSLGDRRG